MSRFDSVWLNVIPSDGHVRRLPSFVGDTLVFVLEKYGIPGIKTFCGGIDPNYPLTDIPLAYFSGGPKCEGCHVVIHEKWFDKMYVSPIEKGRLESLSFPTAKTYVSYS